MKSKEFANALKWTTLGLSAVWLLSACDGLKDSKKDKPNDTSVPVFSGNVDDARSEGDVKVSGALQFEGNSPKISIAGIPDPANPSKPLKSEQVQFKIFRKSIFQSTPVAAFSAPGDQVQTQVPCDVNQPDQNDQRAPIDLVFVNDTTGSMAGVVQGLANSVQKFAQEVAQGGVDARFGMFTYGDVFSTKYDNAPEAQKWEGEFLAPAGDSIARPVAALTDVNGFETFLQKLKASPDLGKGGGDPQENALGALDYAYKKSAWRPGAIRMFVLTGDNPSHQGDTWKSKVGLESWKPPVGEDLINRLSGKAIVHGVVKDKSAPGFYNLKTIAEKSAGTFIELPADGVVDLSALNFKEWLTSSFSGKCEPIPPPVQGETIEILVEIRIESGGKVYSSRLLFTVKGAA